MINECSLECTKKGIHFLEMIQYFIPTETSILIFSIIFKLTLKLQLLYDTNKHLF